MGIASLTDNQGLLQLHKTTFLCSRKIPAGAVLRCYDWAIAQREAGRCVISGFHSKLEQDVLHYLLKGTQPIIVALARGQKQRLEAALQKPLDQGRLLLISPFKSTVTRVTSATAQIRNQLMLQLANEVIVGYKAPDGQLTMLLQELPAHKPVQYLFENMH